MRSTRKWQVRRATSLHPRGPRDPIFSTSYICFQLFSASPKSPKGIVSYDLPALYLGQPEKRKKASHTKAVLMSLNIETKSWTILTTSRDINFRFIAVKYRTQFISNFAYVCGELSFPTPQVSHILKISQSINLARDQIQHAKIDQHPI